MTRTDPTKVRFDIERAIERQAYQGGRESISEILQAVASATSEYWHEVACELHRRQMFYDSLDCWREAEKLFVSNNEEPPYWFQDMIPTLMNAADQTGDSYFKQKALEACQRLITINASEVALNYKLALINDLCPDRDEILSLIEEIFDRGFVLKVDIILRNLKIEKIDTIRDYSDLAECYLWLDRASDALRVWSKAIAKNKNDTKELLSGAILVLNWYAESRGFDDSSYLPENLSRSI